jgi:hypothetical protein
MTTPTYAPTTARVLQGSASPTNTNDCTTGVIVGDLWSYGTSLWYCSDATASSAVWNSISGGGGGGVTSVSGTSGQISSTGGSTPVLALITTGVGASTYGDSTHVAQITVDTLGRITAASSVSISGGGSSAALLTTVVDAPASNVASGNYTLGMSFVPAVAGLTCTGVKVYWAGAATTLDISLWDHAGTKVASGTMSVTSTPGVFTGTFGSSYGVSVGLVYTVSYSDTAGSPQYSKTTTSYVVANAFINPGYIFLAFLYASGTDQYPTIAGAPASWLIDPVL